MPRDVCRDKTVSIPIFFWRFNRIDFLCFHRFFVCFFFFILYHQPILYRLCTVTLYAFIVYSRSWLCLPMDTHFDEYTFPNIKIANQRSIFKRASISKIYSTHRMVSSLCRFFFFIKMQNPAIQRSERCFLLMKYSFSIITICLLAPRCCGLM